MPILVAAWLLTACAAQPPEHGTVQNLALWQQIGATAWTFADTSAAAGPGTDAGYLVSREQYRDFSLSVEFRIDNATNSGVFVRCNNKESISPVDCYEINIFDNHPNQDFRTGAIVTRQAPLAHVDTLGRWNHYDIDVRGDRIVATVNGVVTADLEDASLDEGYIALQYAGTGEVSFRNLRIDGAPVQPTVGIR